MLLVNSNKNGKTTTTTLSVTWGSCHGGDVMVLKLHFVMVSQQFVMGLSLVTTFHYAQITTFVGNLTKIVEICSNIVILLCDVIEQMFVN